jgi:CubicO group peptidase (beta-lactamase class C family)
MPGIVRIVVSLCLLASIFPFQGCKSAAEPEYESLEEEIGAIIAPYVRVGGMVGIIDGDQERLVLSYGTKSIESSDPPDANTTFEIGSITKTFTCVLLAQMYLSGQFIDDTVDHYLPESQVTMPTWNGVEIQFIHLATHTSGLPRKPQGSSYPLPPGYDPLNPYAAYTAEHIYDYLKNYCALEFEPGTYWLYSNTGGGLIGHVAGLVDGTSYQTVLTREILDVLEMDRTSLFLTSQQTSNLALGYDIDGNPVPNWTAQDIFQGCGFMKSTLNDMFTYMEANLGLIDTPLREAMDLTYDPQFHQGSLGDIGLAWYILELEDGQVVINHGGGTGGYVSYLGFNTSRSTGAIVLLNSKIEGDVYAIGQQMMEAIENY